MRRLLIALGITVGVFAALFFWRYEAGWNLTFLLNPGGAFDAAEAGPAPTYDSADAWFAQTTATDASAAVFYIHPTTLLKTTTWNQPIANERADGFLDSVAPGQISVFSSMPVSAPFYRQAAFYAFIEKSQDSDAAIALATSDVVQAFKTFVAQNPEGPIVIAGHSQGAYHAIALLHAISDDEALLTRIAAVYAIGYPFPADYFETLSPFPLCARAGEAHCVVSFNARGRGAFVPGFFEKTPLPVGAERADAALACWNPARETSVVAARCDEDGWLLIDRPPEDYRDFLMSREWYHTVELKLFADEIRSDAETRAAAMAQ